MIKKQDKLDEIWTYIQNGEKIRAIKEFMDLYHCSLHEGKAAVEEMESSGICEWEHYGQYYNKPKGTRKGCLPVAVILFVLLVVGPPRCSFCPTYFCPSPNSTVLRSSWKAGRYLRYPVRSRE